MSFSSDLGAVEYFAGFARLFGDLEITLKDGTRVPIDDGISRAVDLVSSLRRGGKALLAGNGGSAAIVSHMHNDLCKAVGVRALVFNEAPFLTALANDDGYHTVFARPVDLWAEKDDLFVAVSSGGESENIVTAAARASAQGCRVLTMSGFKPTNRLRQVGDLNIYVPHAAYGYVEMAHSVVGHCITDLTIARGARK